MFIGVRLQGIRSRPSANRERGRGEDSDDRPGNAACALTTKGIGELESTNVGKRVGRNCREGLGQRQTEIEDRAVPELAG